MWVPSHDCRTSVAAEDMANDSYQSIRQEDLAKSLLPIATEDAAGTEKATEKARKAPEKNSIAGMCAAHLSTSPPWVLASLDPWVN